MSYSFHVSSLEVDVILDIPNNVYYPAEDSFLLLDTLSSTITSDIHLLVEIGGGSGLITIALAKKYSNIRFIVNDITFSSTSTIYYNLYLNNVQHVVDVVQMELLRGLRYFKPDIIAWNPPYLPLEEEINLFPPVERKMLFGGKKGYEQGYRLIEFCLKNFLETTIFLVFSSLGWDPAMLNYLKRDKRICAEIVNKKKLPFETLYVLKVEIGV